MQTSTKTSTHALKTGSKRPVGVNNNKPRQEAVPFLLIKYNVDSEGLQLNMSRVVCGIVEDPVDYHPPKHIEGTNFGVSKTCT